jgi:hypothetical protein
MTNKKPKFNLDHFFQSAIITLILLSFYSALYTILIHIFLPDGVNYVFTGSLWKFALCAVPLFILIYVILRRKQGAWKLQVAKSERVTIQDVLLFLLPLTPVAQYVVNNRGILSAGDIALILAVFAVFAAIFIIGIPALLGSLCSPRALRSLGMAFTFTLTSMALLSRAFDWYRSGSLLIQVLLLAGVFGFVYAFSGAKNRVFLAVLIVILFTVNTIYAVISTAGNDKTAGVTGGDNPLQSALTGKTVKSSPNIYLLVYDAYVSNETLKAHGIDNSQQEQFLVGEGFTLYPNTYTLGATTLDSMSKVLNVDTGRYDDDRRIVSGDGVVQNIFKSLGYTTYGVFHSDFMFRGIGSTYDYSVPASTSSSSEYLISAILIGEFRFDLGFQKNSHEVFVEKKLELFQEIAAGGGNVFLYTHTSFPNHAQNSGACQVDEVAQFAERLKTANSEMTADVEAITASDPTAIIIVAGDHGPILTKNCTYTSTVYDLEDMTRPDIQDRYGSFLAIRWPDGDYQEYDDIVVLQDLFPVIFSYMYEDNSILETKLTPVIDPNNYNSGISVVDGIIVGGVNDGEPLYLSGK